MAKKPVKTKSVKKKIGTKRYATQEKVEEFCLAYMDTGNKTESYRQAYPDSKATPRSTNQLAYQLFNSPAVQSSLIKLRERNVKANDITFMSMYDKLDEAYKLSVKIEQPQTMVSATKAQIDLLGFNKSKEEKEEKASRFTLTIDTGDK